MAAAPLDSSSTPPGAAAAESDQTRFHGDPMEDTDPQSTRKRPRLDSGSRVCESWSTDEMSGRTAAATAPVTAADGAADQEASAAAASRPASRVTINVKSPTTGSRELESGPVDDPATSSSSSTTLPDQSSSAGGAPPTQSQSADTSNTAAGQASNNAISLSSSPVQSPEIEVADVEDVDQDTNTTSTWKPLGEAMRDRVTPEVVQLQDQLSLTDTFPKLHEHLGLRENLDEVCAIIEKGEGRKTHHGEAGRAVLKLRRSTGNPHDVTVFLAVKNWLDDAVNNLDQLTYDTYTDDRDFWEEFPVMVEFLLRRVQDFQPDEDRGPWECFEEFFVNFGRMTLHLARLDTLALGQLIEEPDLPAPEMMSKSYLISLGWCLQLNNIPFFRNMERIHGSEMINLIARVNDRIAAPPLDAMWRLSELAACVLALIHRLPYLSHVLIHLLTVAHNLAESGNERKIYGADDDLIASPVYPRTIQTVYSLVRAVDEKYQLHITKKSPWVTSDTSESVLRLIAFTYHAISQCDPNLRLQLAKALPIDLPGDATPNDCSLIIHYGWKFAVLKKHIMDGRMELRVHGMETMQLDLVSIWRQYIQNSSAGLDHPLVPYLVKFLRDNQIVEYIVGIDSHPQLISRSGNIVGFLIVTLTYTDQDTDTIWRTVTESQDSRTVSEVLGMLTRTFHMHPSTSPVLLGVCSKLLELPLNRFDGRMVDFCDQLFYQIREKHGQRNSHDPMDTLHVDAIPLRLCVRLIRESAAAEDISVEHKALLQQFASSQLNQFSVTGVSETDKMEMYERCIQDFAETNQFTVGSIQALNALLSGQDAQETRKLATEFDLTGLAINEIAHAVDTNQTDFTDSFSRNGFISRVHMLARIIDKVPDTITTDLGDILWKKIFMSTAIVQQGRRTLWDMLCGLTGHGFMKNPFIERCIHEFVPALSPDDYSPEVLSFAKQTIIYEIRFNPPSIAKENEVVSIPGMDRIWDFILTAPPNSIETDATNFAIEVYLDHNVIRMAPRSAVEATHIALVDRCVEQLKSAATKLKSFHNNTPNGQGESMVTDEVRPAELSFSRSLLFLRQLLQGLRTRPQYSPPQGPPPDLPGAPVKGDAIEIPYQTFSAGSQSKVHNLRIGDLSTASELSERIVQLTGFSKFKTIYGGQRVDLLEKPDLILRDMKLRSGLLLIRKDADSSEISPIERRQSATPVDSEVLKHFDDLYDLLNVEDHLAREIYDFLVVFPPQERVLQLVKSQDKTEQDMLPMEKPYSFLYSLKALSVCLREEALKPSPNPEFVSHSIRVLVAALTRPEMMESLADSPTKLLYATSLVECLLLALLVKPPVDDSSLIMDPASLVQQLLNLMDVGRHVPATHLSAVDIQKLICNSFAVLTEGSVRDEKFWHTVKQQTEFDRLLFSLLLDERRQPIRKEISENIALVCTPAKLLQRPDESANGQPIISENSTKVDIIGTIWEAFARTIPQTPNYAHQTQEFFEVALLAFHSVAEQPSSDINFDEYLKQWSNIMLGHETEEFVGRELVDHHLLGLTRLLRLCLDRAQSAEISVDTFDLTEKLFDRYLFPDLSMPSDEAIVPRIPVMHNQTRIELYNILTLLVKDDRNYFKVVDHLEDIIPQDYTYSQAWCLDRQRMIRSPEGYAGLKNLSNTCYLNSLLTQLFMNVGFRDFMLQLNVTDPEASQKLLDETKKLFGYMQETWLKSVDPQGLVDTIRTYDNEPIDVTIQMDVDEFYNLLFDRWEAQVLDSEEKKKFRSFYGGQLVQQIKSKECTHISERLEPFSAIQCDIKGKASLEESLQAYVEGEIMQGDNKYSCTSCGRHVDAVKRACLKDVPDNLIFHLKRFDFDMVTMMRNKINDEFQFPEYIDMTPFNVEYLSEQSTEIQPDIFELVGVLVHSGTAESGHYYSYIRERPTAGSPGSWVEFNDSDVSRFDPSKIADQCFGGINNSMHTNNVRFNKSWNAYMLFYQRVSSTDAPQSIQAPSGSDTPTSFPVPLSLKNHIAMENEVFIRAYCLLDPYHAIFVQYILHRLQGLTDSETVTKYKLDKSAIFIVLDTLEQLISRSKDHLGLDENVAELSGAIMNLPMGAYRVFEWVAERPTGIRNLLLKTPHPNVRSSTIKIMVTAVAKLRKLRENTETGNGEKEQWQIRYIDSFDNIITALENLWPILYTASRSWDDYFEFLILLASFGSYEVGVILDSGFLHKCLEMVWLDNEDPKRLRRQYLGYVKLVEKGRQFSHKKLMDLLSILLSQIDFTVTATADDDRPCLPDGRYPLTVTEDEFVRALGKSRDLVMLKKVLHQYNNSQACINILGVLLDAEPEAGLIDPICKVLEDGLRVAPAELCAPFLDATLHFCRQCRDEERISYLIDFVAKGVDSISNSGGAAHLTFFTNLLNIRNDRLELNETWFLSQMIDKIPDWAPTLLVYPERAVRNMTLETLRQTLFDRESEGAGEEWQSRHAEVAKELVHACVDRLRKTYLSTPGQTVEAKIVEATKTVINHCLATYFDSNAENDQEFVHQARAVNAAIDELSADVPEELASESDVPSPEEWEDNSMIASDSEMGLAGSP